MNILIRKIIREELEMVLNTLSELELAKSNDYDNVVYKNDSRDHVIYNYEKGREFAGNNLEIDIDNLNRYHLTQYLPKSISEESWEFEFETVYGSTLIIDIIRQLRGGKSFWTLRVGQLYRGEKHPNLIEELENVEGYEQFIEMVNKKISSKIDVSKY